MSDSESEDDQNFSKMAQKALQRALDLDAESKRDHVLEALLRGDPKLPISDGPKSSSSDASYDADETKERPSRRVFREWPRDPSGVVFDPSICTGKSAPNGTELWGARLYDFYHVTLDPLAADDTRKNRAISTSSRLSAWAKKVGETNLVKEEMVWADQEAEPKLRLAADILTLIEDRDWLLPFGIGGGNSARKKDQNMETTPSPANCLHPWPYVPFSYKPYILQSPVPLHLLPQTLIVHDPWGLVHGKLVDGDHDSFDWTDIPDVTYTYKLRLSKEGQERITESRQAAETAARASSSPHVLLTIAPKSESASDSDSSIAAPVFVTVPPPSPPPSHTPEAHLYISPAQTWGEGHHSIAYEAEWEVPRSILSVSKDSQSQGARICRECVAEAAKKILAEKEARRQSALDAYLASKRVPAGDSDSDDDVIIVGPLRGKVEYVKNVTPAAAIDVSRCTTVLDRTPVPSSSSTTLPPKTAPHTVQSEMKEEIGLYRGPVTTIHVDSVPWLLPGQRASICPHSGSRLPGPPTASVRVLAKLSRTGGRHLSQEASIYERLPESMSEHWTGFNVVPPLENPTPLGAIIPNYYGYYARVREDGGFEDENCVQAQDKDEDAMDVDDPEAKEVPREEFFSSILLTENCGGRIDLFQEELDASRDEREECAALLLRLHHFGWVLGACHVGKFLIQFGDHADWPIFKSRNDRRYRISGLSRAWSREDALADGRLEEWETLRQEEVQLCTKMLNLEVPASPGRKDER